MEPTEQKSAQRMENESLDITESKFGERTEYKSAASTPKILVIVATALMLARGIDLACQAQTFLHPGAKKMPAAKISWQQLRTTATAKSEPAKPPEPEISAAVQEELDLVQGQAAAAHKILLYQFYASWSDPCKRMDESALQNSEVASEVEKKFYPVHVRDMQHETGRNNAVTNALFKKYRVFAFPTLVAVNEKGEQIGSLIGSCSSLTTYRFLTRTISSNPTVSLAPAVTVTGGYATN